MVPSAQLAIVSPPADPYVGTYDLEALEERREDAKDRLLAYQTQISRA